MGEHPKLTEVEQFVLERCRASQPVTGILKDAKERGYNVSINLVLDAIRHVVKEAGLQPVVYTIEQGSFCWTCPQCGGYVIRKNRPYRTVKCDSPYCQADLWYSALTGDLIPYHPEHHALHEAVDSLRDLLSELSDTADLVGFSPGETSGLLQKINSSRKILRESFPSWDIVNGNVPDPEEG